MNASKPTIKFREDWNRGHVVVFENNKQVYSNSAYRVSAEWAQARYGLTEAELYAIYVDYKEDYDS